MSFEILTDTSANLPPELLARENIAVIPFPFTVDGVEVPAAPKDFDGPAFYAAMRGGAAVATSLIRPQDYAAFFRARLEQGKDLLFVGMSSGISGSFHCAELAAEELREEFPERRLCLVDSLGASLGEGLLVLRAIDYRREGFQIDAVTAMLETLKNRVCQVFTVDDLRYLRKGGRLSNVAAVVGAALHIKPLLKGDEAGRIVFYGKARGRQKAIEALAERYDALVKSPETQTVGIAHADCPGDAALLEALLRRSHPPKEILTVCYEPVTGSHVGPGTLALFFLDGRNAR